MARHQNRYEHINKIEDDLSEEISNLKAISASINKQLKKQQNKTGVRGLPGCWYRRAEEDQPDAKRLVGYSQSIWVQLMYSIWNFIIGHNNFDVYLIYYNLFSFANYSSQRMSNPEEIGQNQNAPQNIYATFQASSDEQDNLLNQMAPTPEQKQRFQRENDTYQLPMEKDYHDINFNCENDNDGMYDAFKVEGFTPDMKKNQRSQGVKKQIPIEQALLLIEEKLSQSTTIQSKINGFKLLSDRIKQTYKSQHQIQTICSWMENIKLVENFFHQDSHPQILRNMPTVLKFLYENDKIRSEQISMYALFALKAHEEYLKVVQSLFGFLKIEDLCSVFELISQESDFENHNLVSLLSNIVGNKYFFGQSLTSREKKSKQRQSNNILTQQLQFHDPIELMERIDVQNQQDQSQIQGTKALTINLFKFLIRATDCQINAFYPILNKLITSKHVFLSPDLSTTIPELLKNNKTNGIWILQHCLRIDFGHSNKLKGNKNQTRFNFIQKLVNQHLYEHLLIILSKVRFNKAIVDKILNIFILLSKNYKPLEDVYTKYIWKILGLQSKQEKQREQFFNFVKDILRNQSNFTEQSVNFIFFEVLMSLRAEWFSLKILDCLQMLFMRLNEDLKLISYTDHTYEIQDPDFVGIDKFWYIYFYSNDPKVTKKCKDFLWKMTTYNNIYEIKNKLLREYIDKIISYMSDCSPDLKTDFCNKGFDIIDKLMEEAPKKEVVIQTIQLTIKNQCKNAIAPKKIDLKLSEKCNFRALKQQIALAICPSNQEIKLITKGQTLKGDKMTLKELNLQNGNTIMVVDAQPQKKQKKSSPENVQNIIFQITQIFGSSLTKEFVRFIAQKMEDQQIERIMQAIISEEKLALMEAEFEQAKLKQAQNKQGKITSYEENSHMEDESSSHEMNKIPQNDSNKTMEMQDENQVELQPKQVKFSQILSTSPDYIRELLSAAEQSNKKRGWQTIKTLPNSEYYLQEIQKHIGQQNWLSLFPQQDPNQMICTYNAHLLKHILQTNKSKIIKYMIENGGFKYLKTWLMKVVSEGNYSNIIVEEVTSLLAILLEEYSGILSNFVKRAAKKDEKNLLKLLIEENVWITKSSENEVSEFGDKQFIKWMINLLLGQQKDGAFPSKNIAEILIYYILTNNNALFQILQLPLPQIFRIIQIHGFAGQYIFLTALSKIFIEQELDPTKKYSNKLLNLVDYGFDYTIEANSKSNIIYIYDIVSCIIDCTSHHREKQLKIISNCITTIMGNIDKMESQQLVAMLTLLKLSICKIYGDDKIADSPVQQQEDSYDENSMDDNYNNAVDGKQPTKAMRDENEKIVLNIQISQFSQWLFKNYLFDLEKPGKYTRDKAIRKQGYEILTLISANCAGIGEMLIESILKIQITERNRDDDYIDFRTQDYLGLTNLGATCYINSLLQQIYHTKFSKLLVEKGTKENNEQEQEKIRQLKRIFTQLSYSIKNVVNPKKFIQGFSFYGQPINTSVQQDANQFLLCLFHYLEGEGCRDEVYDVFGGYLCNQITVEDSGSDQIVKNNMEHFNSVTIDIKDRKNLQEALAYYIKPQVLDGQNKYFCEQLGKKMKASRRCYFQKMPNILILTLKRFQFNYELNLRKKLNDYFQFPFDLDMHKFSASYLRSKEESSDSKYKLSGILVHSGSAQSGHYYSYIKIGELWLQFNDKMVSEFNIITNLKSQCFGSSDEKKTKNAYILFYEKAHTSYHGVYLNQIPQSNLYKKQISEQNAIFLKTRLIYEENFRKMLEQLLSTSQDQRLQQFICSIFGKRKKNQELSQIKQERQEHQGNQVVYFDCDQEKQPLISQDSFFDQILNRD